MHCNAERTFQQGPDKVAEEMPLRQQLVLCKCAQAHVEVPEQILLRTRVLSSAAGPALAGYTF